MKCPRCDFMTSNNRVSCPRCNCSFSRVQLAAFDAVQVNFELEEKDFSAFIQAVDKKVDQKKHDQKKAYQNKFYQKAEELNKQSLDDLDTPKIENKHLVEKTSVTESKKDTKQKETEEARIHQEIIVDEQLWKKTEIEIIRDSLKNKNEAFVELNQYNTDDDIALLFELAKIELEDPSKVNQVKIESTELESNLSTDLSNAVYDYISEQNKKDDRRKLNIYHDDSSSSLTQIGNIIPTSISKRIFATLIDSIICLMLTLAYTWFEILPEEIKLNISNLNYSFFLEVIPYTYKILSCYFIIWFLLQFSTLCTLGGTIGCQFMKIAVCNAEGYLLTAKQSMLRALSWSATILTVGLGNLLVFKQGGQTLHDKISKTFVINLNQ